MIACNRLSGINRKWLLASVCIMALIALLVRPPVNCHARGPDPGPEPAYFDQTFPMNKIQKKSSGDLQELVHCPADLWSGTGLDRPNLASG